MSDPALLALVVLHAANAEDERVSAIVLDKSVEAAAETLADRRSFVLDAKQYDAFVTTVDAPPKSRPRLERLFAEAGPLPTAVSG